MKELYERIIQRVVESGERIEKKTGKIQDIGVTKRYVTEEDLRIERELKQIVKDFDPSHEFYAEEENEDFLDAEHVWVVDPISGTRTFIDGLAHYGIVASHLHNGKVQFAAVYDPSMNELYTAYRGKGAYLNGEKISIDNPSNRGTEVVLNLSRSWKDSTSAHKIMGELGDFDFYRTRSSHAINECHVACGKYDGVISLTKDSFPYFASSLIIQEAGGVYTNLTGEDDIHASDRVFIGGSRETYEQLKAIVENNI